MRWLDMTKIIVDSWAWIEYLEGSQRGERVKHLIEDNDNDVYSSVISIGEMTSKFIRRNKDEKIVLDAVTRLSKVVLVDEEIAFSAGKIHALMKQKISDFGLADAFIIATANQLECRIVTGDPHFRNVKEAIMI